MTVSTTPTSFTQLVSLTQMQNTVRRMTARYTEAQMTTSLINTYLNLAYTIHFPLHFKNLKLTKPYVFTTVPNVDTYYFIYEQSTFVISPIPPTPPTNALYPPGNIQITPPIYCQGYILRYYQDKTTFYNRWPNLSVNQIINVGTGIANTYTGTINPFPFYRAQLDLFGNVTEAAVIISSFDNTGFNYTITDVPQPDNNIGNLVDMENNVVGTVNYLTGVYSFTPANATVINAGAEIYAAVVPYQASRPTDVLFYNQQLVFRPCPLQIYQVEFQISQQPTQLIASNQAPELDEWYLFLCAIAAKLIYTDFPDEQGMAYLMPIYQEQLQLAQRRTLRQMGSQRAATIFSQPGRPLASWFWGTEYSGNSG
jgi:hypothetical protein